MSIKFTEFSHQVAGLTFAGLRWGNPNGEKCLMMHGWLDNGASFLPMAPYLKDYDCLSLDLPGHGRSSHKPEICHYHFVDAVAEVKLLIDAIHWGPCHVIGHSLGGAIASLLAGAHPEVIKQLVLIDAVGVLTEPAEKSLERFRHAHDKAKELSQKTKKPHPSLESALKARLIGSDLTEAEVSILAERGVNQREDGYYWTHDPKLTLPGRLRLTEDHVHAFLTAIKSPTLIIKASQGIDTKMQHFERRAEWIHNHELHTLEGGHHIHMQQPKTVGRLVVGFLSK